LQIFGAVGGGSEKKKMKRFEKGHRVKVDFINGEKRDSCRETGENKKIGGKKNEKEEIKGRPSRKKKGNPCYSSTRIKRDLQGLGKREIN